MSEFLTTKTGHKHISHVIGKVFSRTQTERELEYQENFKLFRCVPENNWTL